MSLKSIGTLFVSYVLVNTVGTFAFLFFWLDDPKNSLIGSLFLNLFLFSIFVVLFYHYSKKEKLVEIKHKLYRSLYENNQQLILLIDLKGHFIRVNKTMLRVTGFDENEILGKHYTTYLKEAYLTTVTQKLEATLCGKTTEFELEFATKEGRDFYAKAQCSPIMFGGKVNSVMMVVKDITEETTVKKTLLETQRNLKLINEHASEMIAVLDEKARLLFTTPSFRHVFDQSPETYYGKNLFHALEQPESMEEILHYYNRCLQKNEVFYYSFVRNYDNGDVFYFESVGTPIVEENGVVHQMVCVIRDVTERKKQEDLLHQTERLHLAGEMAASVAHEIKNPLASIRGFVQLFESENTNEKNETFYPLVLREIDRVNEIVTDLMTLAKPRTPQMTSLNIEYILEDMNRLLFSEANLKGVRLILSTQKEEVLIRGDEIQLKQVYINVVKNAIEASEAGSTVTITSKQKDGVYHLWVNDEGCGIETERIPRLGEAFHTSKKDGTGLGLLVTKRILEAHDGTVAFESVNGKGTTVHIMLPCQC